MHMAFIKCLAPAQYFEILDLIHMLSGSSLLGLVPGGEYNFIFLPIL